MPDPGIKGMNSIIYTQNTMNRKDISSYLQPLKIKGLNEMQQATLEAYSRHDDIMLLSDTGSGKTLAYLLPIVQSLQDIAGTQAMIVAPSRELAQQIETVFRQMQTGYKITCCYGGHKREIEENNLLEAPAVIVGTPGRLGDHIRRGNIEVNGISMLLLDEFDKTLESGFTEEVKFITGSLKNVQKRMLVSATESADIPEFIGLKNPAIINFLSAEKEENKLLLHYVHTDDKDKIDTLYRLLCFIGNRAAIIFCNHRDAVERVSDHLKERGILNVYYHGAMEQTDRDSALAKFRNGSVNFLVTTDIASRGLDIANIRYIVHYHLPATEEVFTHRNGRTARMDASGSVVLMKGPDENIPAYIETAITELQLPEECKLPPKPDWVTLFMPLGKKDKVNKIDIVGFLLQKANLKKEDVGLIEVKDFHSFFAIRRAKTKSVFHLLKDERIKNKKAKISIAK